MKIKVKLYLLGTGDINSSAVIPVSIGTLLKFPLLINLLGSSRKNLSWPKSGSITGIQGITGHV